MLLDVSESQLVLVDYQLRLMPVMHEAQAVRSNAIRLARSSVLLGVPAVLTEQNPQGLGPTEPTLRDVFPPGQVRVIEKQDFSAAQAGLVQVLQPPQRAAQQGGNARSLPKHLQKAVPSEPVRGSVVLAGCEAHVCLLQTALELLEQEFDVWVVTDACSSRTERNRDAAFDRLAGAGVELVTTEMVVFEWLRSAEHPQFKAVQALVK